MAKGSLPTLVTELERRQEQVAALEARLAVLKAAPSVLSLEVRRLEKETATRLGELRDVFARNPREARKVIERLLDGGKLTFTPLHTEQGKRYQIEGRVGEVLQIPTDPAAPYRLRPRGDRTIRERLWLGELSWRLPTNSTCPSRSRRSRSSP